MASILPQLEFLSINSSVNGQIPYLLRSVLPNGLPKLKSLDITQIQDHTYNVRELEGAMWYETENGEFRQDTRIRRASRPMTDHCYIHSITRGAPNIEELCLRGFPLAPGHLVSCYYIIQPSNRLYLWHHSDSPCPYSGAVVELETTLLQRLSSERVPMGPQLICH